MTARTRRRLIRTADLLEGAVHLFLEFVAWSLQLLCIDAAWGKGKYRKRGPKLRPIIHRTYNRTVVVRPMLPSERVMPVKYQR